MIKNNTVLCIILARGGSKGVPKKNIQPILGIPLIAYTILSAKKSKYIDRIIVSSDDKEIREIAINYGVEAPFKRPAKLSTDNSNANDAFKHAVKWSEKDFKSKYSFLIQLLPTNPFKTSSDIDNVINKLYTTKADSVIGVAKLEDHHPIRIKKIVDDKIQDFCLYEAPGTNRQDLKPDAYIRNGSIYACKRQAIDYRIGSDNSRPYIMPAERSINIDQPLDFLLAETIMKKLKN